MAFSEKSGKNKRWQKSQMSPELGHGVSRECFSPHGLAFSGPGGGDRRKD